MKYLSLNKRGLDTFVEKVRNISVAFLESCLSISEANQRLTGVNMKRNQETQRYR